MIFSWFTLLWIFRRKNTKEICHSCYITSRVHAINMTSLLILTLITWLRWYLPDFSIVKLFFFPLLHTVPFGRKSLCVARTYWVDSNDGRFLYKLFRIILHWRFVYVLPIYFVLLWQNIHNINFIILTIF